MQIHKKNSLEVRRFAHETGLQLVFRPEHWPVVTRITNKPAGVERQGTDLLKRGGLLPPFKILRPPALTRFLGVLSDGLSGLWFLTLELTVYDLTSLACALDRRPTTVFTLDLVVYDLASLA